MIKVIVLDLDDTLYDERKFVYNGFYEVASYLDSKYEISKEKIFDEMKQILKDNGRGKIFNEICERYKLTEDIVEMVEIYRDNKGKLSLYDDTVKMFDEFKGSYRYGMITDGCKKAQWNKIKALKLGKIIDQIIVTDDYGKEFEKPSIKPFQLILEKFNIKPCEMLYVGDNPNKDFEPCNNLGIVSVRIIRPNGDHMKTVIDGKEANFTINKLTELINVVKRLNKQNQVVAR